jgi:hypothetical protein
MKSFLMAVIMALPLQAAAPQPDPRADYRNYTIYLPVTELVKQLAGAEAIQDYWQRNADFFLAAGLEPCTVKYMVDNANKSAGEADYIRRLIKLAQDEALKFQIQTK